MFEAVELATMDLGVVYAKPIDDHYQVLDCQYYISSCYYVSLIFYEVWPVQVGGKTSSLIWRGDFISATTLSITKGIDRMAYGGIMLQEIKKSIRCFQQDAAKVPRPAP